MTYPLPSTSVDLVFEAPASGTGGPVNLVFGATLSPPPATVYEATLNAKFLLRGAVAVNYDSGQWRGFSSGTVMRHGQAAAANRAINADWATPELGNRPTNAPFGAAGMKHTSKWIGWRNPVSAQRAPAYAWSAAAPTARAGTVGWRMPSATPRGSEVRWQPGAQLGSGAGLVFRLARRMPRTDVLSWKDAAQLQLATSMPSNRAAKAMPLGCVLPWQMTRLMMANGGPLYLPPTRAPNPEPPVTLIDLAFCALYPEGGNVSPTLIFGLNPCGSVTPDSALYILPERFYMAVHSIEAHLLPSLSSIPIYDVSLQADVGSFAWTFAASGPTSLFDALAPTGGEPAQIRVTIDGLQWVFVVDSLQRQAEFGKTGARISGRSATALVGAPYSRELARLNSGTQNAQQLAASALNLSGVGLDWSITDWSVPAGAWSHTGTPLAAVQAIAESAGGYVASHRANPTLLVRHPYPTLPGGIPGGPWNWGGAFAADVELAPDSIITSSIERRDGPDVDGVYVSGTAQGLLALVRRTGTLGANLSAMVADPLITANAAASQRGLSVLGAAGAKHMVQISLPVLTGGANPGVLDVGQLVQINESVPWRGRVRSVSVQANMPSVRQSVTLERHLS